MWPMDSHLAAVCPSLFVPTAAAGRGLDCLSCARSRGASLPTPQVCRAGAVHASRGSWAVQTLQGALDSLAVPLSQMCTLHMQQPPFSWLYGKLACLCYRAPKAAEEGESSWASGLLPLPPPTPAVWGAGLPCVGGWGWGVELGCLHRSGEGGMLGCLHGGGELMGAPAQLWPLAAQKLEVWFNK